MRRLILAFIILGLAACNALPGTQQPQPLPASSQTAPSPIPPTRTARATIPLAATSISTLSMTNVLVTPLPTLLHPILTPIPTLFPGKRVLLTWIDMKDASTGWGIDTAGRILHTCDGGKTWKNATPSLEIYTAGGFFALDALQAWATPYQPSISPPTSDLNATIWHTTDGGVSWHPSPTLCLRNCSYDYDIFPEYANPISLQFLDERTGWMLMVVNHSMFQDRYRIYRTTNGGDAWEMVIDNLLGPFVFGAVGLVFQDEQTGWFATTMVDGATDPFPDWSIHKTGDSGHTWEHIMLPTPANLPIEFTNTTVWCGNSGISIIPPSSLDVTIACEVYNTSSTPGPYPVYDYHFHSPDGGNSWQSWHETGIANFITPLDGWRIEDPGSGHLKQLQQTHDGGQTWTTVTHIAWPQVALDFVDEHNGWALVGNGDAIALVQSQDGGRTWNEVKPLAVP